MRLKSQIKNYDRKNQENPEVKLEGTTDAKELEG